MCIVKDCCNQTVSRGLCAIHYAYYARSGEIERFPLKTRRRGTGCISKDGYLLIVRDGHQVPEHRWLMETLIGRKLILHEEDVHHKNGNKLDNRMENLEIISHTVHGRMHMPPKNRICSIKRCNRKHDSHGFCGAHANRFRRHLKERALS